MDLIKKSGEKVVIQKINIGDVENKYFDERDMFCEGSVNEEDLRRKMKDCGGYVMNNENDIND